MAGFEIPEQWQKQFEEISELKFGHPSIRFVPLKHGVVLIISCKEISATVMKMNVDRMPNADEFRASSGKRVGLQVLCD